jgi:hypothetical protein
LGKAAPSEGDTIRAWERFLTGEPDAATPLAQIVIASWQRSLSLGVNPAGRAAPLAAQGDRFFALRHRNRDLIIAAAGWATARRSILAPADSGTRPRSAPTASARPSPREGPRRCMGPSIFARA